MSRLRFPLATFVVFLSIPTALHADDQWPVARGASREPNPYKYDPKVWKKLPKEFTEDSAASLLFSGTTNLVEADGTIETVTHEITRLNGRKAIEKLGEFRHMTFDPAYQKFTLNEARIFKTDGRVVAVEPRHAQLRDVSTDYLVYDHEKVLILSLPNLEVGDVFEAKWSVRGKNPEHGGQFFTRYAFGDTSYPVALDQFAVRLPKSMPFHHAVVGGKDSPAVTEDDDTRTYVWKSRDNKPQPQDENLPSRDELHQSVVVSTFRSWEDVGKWKQQLRAECWVCNDQMCVGVARIIKGITDPAEKARVLTYWLRRNIRYVSSGERHDYTPHTPWEVYINRCGDCKDTSQMLAVMLREAGIKVELATLGTFDDGQVLADVPSPWGTHAILLATIDGKEHWIDTTSSLSQWDLLPRDDRDRACYLVDDKGNIRLHRTPKLTIDENRLELTTHVWVGSDGSTRCEREGVFYGLAAVRQRDSFLETPAGERRRIVTNELQDSNSRARLVRLAIDEFALRDFDAPVKVRMTYEVPFQFSGQQEKDASFSDPKTWSWLLGYNLDYDRDVSMVYYAPFESVHRYVVHVPPAFRLESVPSNKSVTCKWGSFTVRVKPLKGGHGEDVEMTFVTRLESPRIDAEGFDEFRQFHEELGKSYRVWLTLKPVDTLADAKLLEAVAALTPGDTESAAVLAKLYMENNRDADARRVLARACRYAPKNAELWELMVKAAATADDEEKAQRQLVKLFPDEPKHALALGSILASAGKYEQAAAVLEPLKKKGSPAVRAEAEYHLARGLFEEGKAEEALKQLNEANLAVLVTANGVKARLLLGRVNEKLGKMKEAKEAYQDALDLDAGSRDALEALIGLAITGDRREEALTLLRRYTALAGNSADNELTAADCYLRLGRDDEALDLAARVRAKAFHEKAHRITGLVYLRRGDALKAVEYLDKAEMDATVAEGLLRATMLMGNLGDVQKRLDNAERVRVPGEALKKTAERARALIRRRDELAKQLGTRPGDELKALGYAVCAEQALADGRSRGVVGALLGLSFADGVEVGPALALRGRLALDQGKLSKALADAERAVAVSPTYPVGYFVRGRVRLEREAEGGLADLEKAAALGDRQDALVLHTLADALFRLGRAQEALKTQREAAKLKPADRDIAEQLQEFEKAIGG
jgi:tetratricopeptide (TPR) repeat protein